MLACFRDWNKFLLIVEGITLSSIPNGSYPTTQDITALQTIAQEVSMQIPEIHLDPQCFHLSQKLSMVRKRGPDVKEYLRMAFDGADQPAVACSLQLNRRGVGLRFHPDNHRQQHDLPSGQLPSHQQSSPFGSTHLQQERSVLPPTTQGQQEHPSAPAEEPPQQQQQQPMAQQQRTPQQQQRTPQQQQPTQRFMQRIPVGLREVAPTATLAGSIGVEPFADRVEHLFHTPAEEPPQQLQRQVPMATPLWRQQQPVNLNDFEHGASAPHCERVEHVESATKMLDAFHALHDMATNPLSDESSISSLPAFLVKTTKGKEADLKRWYLRMSNLAIDCADSSQTLRVLQLNTTVEQDVQRRLQEVESSDVLRAKLHKAVESLDAGLAAELLKSDRITAVLRMVPDAWIKQEMRISVEHHPETMQFWSNLLALHLDPRPVIQHRSPLVQHRPSPVMPRYKPGETSGQFMESLGTALLGAAPTIGEGSARTLESIRKNRGRCAIHTVTCMLHAAHCNLHAVAGSQTQLQLWNTG